MSDKEETKQKSDDKNYDPTLDIESDKFDPLKAVFSKDFVLPAKNVPVFDNMNMIQSEFKRMGSVEKKLERNKGKPGTSAKPNRNEPRNTVDEHGLPVGRRFLPHQAPIPSRKKTHVAKNLLTWMDTVDGPTKQLKTYLDEKAKVKIYTRKQRGIDGYLTGYIELFDKHWNLSLSDVEECFKRKKYYFSEATGTFGQPRKQTKTLKALGYSLPETKVKSLNRKYVECTRKFSQLFIRGEQIVTIIKLNK